MNWVKIKKISGATAANTYDIWNRADDVYHGEGNFLTNGTVVHNSIPEAVANRDENGDTWKNRLSPEILEILEDTYGVICYHEDTLISLADGRQIPIREVTIGDMVHSVNLSDLNIEAKEVQQCIPTFQTDGIELTLDNGYKLVVTNKHRIYCWDGYKEAGNIKIDDLVASPLKLPQINHSDISEKWLGEPCDVAYLLGFITGDGMCSSSSNNLVMGDIEENADTMSDWLFEKLNIRSNKYYHCRSWYLGITHSEDDEIKLPKLSKFEDTPEWWRYAYDKASGSDIAMVIGRSSWFVYDRLRKYCIITGERRRSKTNKLQSFLRNSGLKNNLYTKRIPSNIMRSSSKIRASYIAGLIDSDGCLFCDNNGTQIVHITSVSRVLLEDVRQLLMLEGITHRLYDNRIFIWNTRKLRELIEQYLVLKEFDGNLLDGNSIGWVPRSELVNASRSYNSQRQFEKTTGISRSSLRHTYPYIRSVTALKADIELGCLRYHRVVSIKPVVNQQFYDLSVADNHNLIANGILASNCYQEQLQSMWQRIAGFTAPEAQNARKAVAKKWTHLLQPIQEKWMAGASRTLGEQEAREWWTKMVTFGRYAFNRCLSKDTLLRDEVTEEEMTVEEWFNSDRLPKLKSFDGESIIIDECVAIHDNGEQEVFEITFDNGDSEAVTMEHKFLCADGQYHTIKEIIDFELEVCNLKSTCMNLL